LKAKGCVGVLIGMADGSRCTVVGAVHDEPLPNASELRCLLESWVPRITAEVYRRECYRSRASGNGGPSDGAARSSDDGATSERVLQLQHARKLESLALLAGGVAHDFNNLLVGILGNCDLLLSELEPHSPLAPTIEEIKSAGIRAADLTRQMLAYSGKGRFVVQRINLNQLIREISPLLGSVVPPHTTLRFDLHDPLPEVEADPAQMRQLITNLLANATEALEQQSGTIRIATGVVDIGHADGKDSTYFEQGVRAGPHVFIEVADTGVGMDPDVQARIFDPFFTTKFTGRGLGLAAVLGIVRGHGGAIRVKTEVGRGSSFRALLPALTVPRVSAPRVPPRDAKSDGASAACVLVVDDEEAVRKVALRVLEQQGFRALLAADGKTALELYAKHATEIAAVLLDVTMPGLTGEQVFSELRRIRPDVRVVLTSGYSENEATATFTGDGLAGFLQKPWVPEDLVRVLREALGLDARPV
jgi:signal transduction histidine kinase/CheY-like chemotaxis protein